MSKKLNGFDFYESLGCPKYVVAPMVDQSELAWRLLGRKYGAQLAYTPMFHAANFVRDPSYRREAIEISPNDRPLIYQFCSNDPDIFTEAAKLVQDHCDAVDLNLGCPQSIAKRGHYGAYLQEEWDLISRMLTQCVSTIDIPVTAKIRAQSSIELTVKYAQMIESCGVSILTIHGRTREQKGVNTGLADWAVIKAVKEALKIPVFANGNIQYHEDIERCLAATGADGVMSAEGHLHNPAIFCPGSPKLVWEMAAEYLELARAHPCNISYTRGHVFKLLHHALHCHPAVRGLVSSAKTVDDLVEAVNELSSMCGPSRCQADDSVLAELVHKHWLCQPYIRPAVAPNCATKRPLEADENEDDAPKVPKTDTVDLAVIYPSVAVNKLRHQRDEERRVKKEARRLCKENKEKNAKPAAVPCGLCSSNTQGLRCEHRLCRTCCKEKRKTENVTCIGHIPHRSAAPPPPPPAVMS